MTKPIGFAPDLSNTPDMLTDVWWFYGNYAEVILPQANFYARRLQEGVDVWQLMWSQSVSSSLDYIPITLRSIGPVSSLSV
jgi:hypothetical protein